VPPVVTAVAAGAITASGATITWTTDHGSDSQVAYGLTSGYGFTSLLDTTLATSHSVTLAGLSASTVYHFQVRTRDGLGLSTASSDVTFTTIAAGPQILLQLHTDETELSAGLTNGSIITPSIGPPGFTGTVVVRPGGTAAFAPAQSGNGVYFQNCCTGTANAYYKFPGPAVGSLFDVKQGEISFSLKSRYSFAQRLTFSSYRTVFDVRDNESDHLFYFLTQASNGWLAFTYRVGSTTTQFYFVPVGKEDTLFGNGVVLNVRIVWDGSTSKLYLNDVQVQSSPNPKATPNWTALSNFDLGAWEYSTYCGYNSSDDVIDEFTVTRGH
jgi:hypothetical protein